MTRCLCLSAIVLRLTASAYGASIMGAGGAHPASPSRPSLAAPPADGAMHANSPFSTLGSSPSGKTLFLKLPDQPSVEAAITAATDAFAKLCDAKPDLTSAFADSRARDRGGAIITASVNRTPVHGWIFASCSPHAASATIIYIANNAPSAETQTLFAALPAPLKTRTTNFPDGSGSIDLPDGWTTKTQSLSQAVAVSGPNRQLILINAIFQMQTPNGRAVQVMNQTYQTKVQIYNMLMQKYRQTGVGRPPQNPGPPPDPTVEYPNMIFSPYCKSADEVVTTLLPILQERAHAGGALWAQIDKLIDFVPADPNPGIANNQVGLVCIAMTNHNGDAVWKSRTIDRISTWPIGPNGDPWTVDITQLCAPDDSFDRDLPVMADIEASLKVDPQWLAQKTKDETAALVQQSVVFRENMKQQSDVHQAQLAASADNFNHYESQVAARSQARHDANSDFIEMISGVRTVYDNQTGESQQVNLSNVNNITTALNQSANDPNRFVQIPLRYER